jgi:hypothetical protein
MSNIRGAFPFPLAQPNEGGGVIALASGGVWYPPSGEWLLQTAANCGVEWWDPIAQFWRNVVSNSNTGDYFSTDGWNYRLHNLTGIVQVASFAAGSGGTNGIGFAATGAAVSIIASNTTGGQQATAYAVVGGSVQAPTITQAGSGFLLPPLVVIDAPPPGGIQATATCALTAGGGIASVTMANVGGGYATSPNFYLIPQMAYYGGGPSGGVAAAASSPPPGLVFPANAVPGNQNTSATGAQLTSLALTGSGTLTGVVMIANGGGYTGTPTGTVTGVGAATVTFSAVTAAAVTQAFVQPRVQ